MRLSPVLASFVLISTLGCTVTEDLPTRPDLIRVSPPTANVPPGGTPISPAPAPSPSPTPAAPSVTLAPAPAPSPSPTPNSVPTPTPTPLPSPQATPTPSPSPSPNGSLPPSQIDSIRVGFFGINCGPGQPVPRNGERLLPRGCRGYVTATPKKANGDDVPPSNHGPNIDWFVLYGDDIIDVQAPTFPSAFNKDVVGVRPGAFGLCATVREVTGCLIGTVIP